VLAPHFAKCRLLPFFNFYISIELNLLSFGLDLVGFLDIFLKIENPPKSLSLAPISPNILSPYRPTAVKLAQFFFAPGIPMNKPQKWSAARRMPAHALSGETP